MTGRNLIVACRGVRLALTAESQEHARRLLPERGGSRADISNAVAGSIDKLLDVPADGAAPIMQDIDVFVADKLLAEAGEAVDGRRLEALLDAWQAAENSLRPEARVAVRLLEAIVREVLHSKDREAFKRWVAREIAPRITEAHTRYVRMFLGVLQGWLGDGGWRSDETGHYLEHLMRDLFRRLVLPLVTLKSSAYADRRLRVASEIIDDIAFDFASASATPRSAQAKDLPVSA